jgi:hypothetical protein
VGSAEDWGWVTTLCWGANSALTRILLNTADSVACFSSLVSVARDEPPRLALLQSLLRLATIRRKRSEAIYSNLTLQCFILFVVFTNKNGEVYPSYRQMFLLFHSQYILAQAGHCQAVREKYTVMKEFHRITMLV